MASELALSTTDQAHGLPALASLARNPSRWTIELARAVAGDRPIEAISHAIAKLRADLAPVPRDKELRAQWAASLDDRLRRLAAKVQPGMPADQGEIWREVMVDALSDLPALVSLTAAKRAIHRPMRFLNEIEALVRELAAEVLSERETAIARLEHLRAEIERAANPLPAIEDHSLEPIEPDEIRAMPEFVRSLGLKAGWLTQQQIDDALAEQPARAAA